MIFEYNEDLENQILSSMKEKISDEIVVIVVQNDYEYAKAIEISNKYAGHITIGVAYDVLPASD